MGLCYFPQLEAAIASEKGLAAPTIPEADNSLPHLIGDWSRHYGDWRLLFDASSFKVILSSSFSLGDYSTSSAFDIGVFRRRK